MLFGRTNVNKFLVEEQRRNPVLADDFSMLISDVVRSCKAVSQRVSRGALAGWPTAAPKPNALEVAQQKPDALSNQAFLQHCDWGGHLAAMSSAVMADIYPIPDKSQRGKYLLVFDPLDGAANIDVN